MLICFLVRQFLAAQKLTPLASEHIDMIPQERRPIPHTWGYSVVKCPSQVNWSVPC